MNTAYTFPKTYVPQYYIKCTTTYIVVILVYVNHCVTSHADFGGQVCVKTPSTIFAHVTFANMRKHQLPLLHTYMTYVCGKSLLLFILYILTSAVHSTHVTNKARYM